MATLRHGRSGVMRGAARLFALSLLAAAGMACSNGNTSTTPVAASSNPGTPSQPPPTPKLAPTEPPTPTPAFAAIADLGTIPPCGPSDLEYITHSNGATGEEVLFDVLLRDRGSANCYLSGRPPVRLFDEAGVRVYAGAYSTPATSPESDVVVLRSGTPALRAGFPVPGQALLRMSWRLVDGGSCSDPSPLARWLEFDLPSGSIRLDAKPALGSVPFTPCRHQLLEQPFVAIPGGPPEPAVRRCGSADLDATMMGAPAPSFTITAYLVIRNTSSTACEVADPATVTLTTSAAPPVVRHEDAPGAGPVVLAARIPWQPGPVSSDLAPAAGQAAAYMMWGQLGCADTAASDVDELTLSLPGGATVSVRPSDAGWQMRTCGSLTMYSLQPAM